MAEMIEVKTAELIGQALDWAAALATGYYMQSDLRHLPPVTHDTRDPELWRPSENWAHGGPLIDKYEVSIISQEPGAQPCAWTENSAPWHGDTNLIAACRAIVATKSGETVYVPKELMP